MLSNRFSSTPILARARRRRNEEPANRDEGRGNREWGTTTSARGILRMSHPPPQIFFPLSMPQTAQPPSKRTTNCPCGCSKNTTRTNRDLHPRLLAVPGQGAQNPPLTVQQMAILQVMHTELESVCLSINR